MVDSVMTLVTAQTEQMCDWVLRFETIGAIMLLRVVESRKVVPPTVS